MDCADEAEIATYLATHNSVLMQSLSYIDYEDVVALDGHVRLIRSDIEAHEFVTGVNNPIKFSFVES